MKKSSVAAGAFLAAMAASLLAGSEGKVAGPRNIILVGWDGAGRENVEELLRAGELPGLARLTRDGSLVAVDVLRTTDTKAGWAQILTGYEPERTGVFSNTRYEPIPKGFSIFERLERFFKPGKIFTAAIISKDKNMDTEPPELVPVSQLAKQGVKIDESDIVLVDGVAFKETHGGPYHFTQDGVDVFENGLGTDQNVGARALEVLEANRDKRFFCFFHFGEIDRKGHMFGEDSAKYAGAIVQADEWLGKIIDKLDALGILDRTLVYVTADHGFDEGGTKHFDAPYVWLGTNDPQIMRRGERADIAPTILSRFGMDLNGIQPPLDGRTMTEKWDKPLF